MSEERYKGTVEQIAIKYELDCRVHCQEECIVVPYDKKDTYIVRGCEKETNYFGDIIYCAKPKRKITIIVNKD